MRKRPCRTLWFYVSLAPDDQFILCYPPCRRVSMAARDIEYVELYTSDKRSAVDYLTLSLGFTQVAESRDHDKNSALLRQGKVQLLVTAGPGTLEFLDAHGDGVADIALTCDDVASARDAAVAAGISVIDSAPGIPVISGFGGTCHTLLSATAAPGPRLPPGRAWRTTSRTAGPPAPPAVAEPQLGP